MRSRGNGEGRTSKTSSTKSDAQADRYDAVFAIAFERFDALRVWGTSWRTVAEVPV